MITKVFNGGVSVDDRGSVRFVNDFNFKDVKRFYQVENHSKGFIRAWHGHLLESKYVYVTKGTIKLIVRKLLTFEDADKKLHVSLDCEYETVILSHQSPKVLYIPQGYANGFKTLEENTSVLFFSTVTMEDAMHDDYRFDCDINNKIWESIPR